MCTDSLMYVPHVVSSSSVNAHFALPCADVNNAAMSTVFKYTKNKLIQTYFEHVKHE